MKLKFTIIILLVISFPAYCQVSDMMEIYPFIKGERNDSLKTMEKRVKSLINTRSFFEKTYLKKSIVFIGIESQFDELFNEKPYLLLNETPKKYKKYLKKIYCKSKRKLISTIKENNKLIVEKNKNTLIMIKNSPGVQLDLIKISDKKDYEIVFVPNKIVIKQDDRNPLNTTVSDSIRDSIEQVLLGIPHNINGYVNSINYQKINFTNSNMPELIEILLNETLKFSKDIILKEEFFNKIKDSRINYKEFSGTSKLWVNTNVSQKVINLSPYLIRAVFNISFYQIKLLKLTDGLNDDRLRRFFVSKEGATVKEINDVYFRNFIELFL